MGRRSRQRRFTTCWTSGVSQPVGLQCDALPSEAIVATATDYKYSVRCRYCSRKAAHFCNSCGKPYCHRHGSNCSHYGQFLCIECEPPLHQYPVACMPIACNCSGKQAPTITSCCRTLSIKYQRQFTLCCRSNLYSGGSTLCWLPPISVSFL